MCQFPLSKRALTASYALLCRPGGTTPSLASIDWVAYGNGYYLSTTSNITLGNRT